MTDIATRKWGFDLNPSKDDLTASLYPLGYQKNLSLSSIADKHSKGVIAKDEEDKTFQLKQSRAMAIGTAPFKNLLPTAFMMYMSGSSIQIFSIMITAMALFNPIKALFGINTAFASLEEKNSKNDQFLQAKLVYTFANFVAISVAVYKLGTMGLLPTTSADWTWLLPVKQAVELSTMAVEI